MKKGIIFDMDGTLWDSASGVAKSWTRVVNQEYDKNRVITTEDIQSVMGKTMDKIAEILFPELEEKARLELIDHCGLDENDYLRENGGTLYPDLEATLQVLKEKYHLYIVSNCQSGYIEAFLEYYGFGHYFEDIECYGNNLNSKGKNIALVEERNHLTDAIYVGDLRGDYDATLEAGITSVHAAYGFGTIDQETAKINSFAQQPQVAAEILGE